MTCLKTDAYWRDESATISDSPQVRHIIMWQRYNGQWHASRQTHINVTEVQRSLTGFKRGTYWWQMCNDEWQASRQTHTDVTGVQRSVTGYKTDKYWGDRGATISDRLKNRYVLVTKVQRSVIGLKTDTYWGDVVVSWCFEPSQSRRITSGLILRWQRWNGQ